VAVNLRKSIIGHVPLRDDAVPLVRDVAEIINALKEQEENDYDYPRKERLSPAQIEQRAGLIREHAHTKAIAKAVRDALGDMPIWGLPTLAVVPDTPMAGGVQWLVYNDSGRLETDSLIHVLRWVLGRASDAPYARYDRETIEFCRDKSSVIDSHHAIVTRSETYFYGDITDCNAMALELALADQKHRAQHCNDAKDPSPLREVIDRCMRLRRGDFFIHGKSQLLAALLAQDALSRHETGELVLIVAENHEERWLSHVCYRHHGSGVTLDMFGSDDAAEDWVKFATALRKDQHEEEPVFSFQSVQVGREANLEDVLRVIARDWGMAGADDSMVGEYRQLLEQIKEPLCEPAGSSPSAPPGL